jgi:hypothetical protein
MENTHELQKDDLSIYPTPMNEEMDLFEDMEDDVHVDAEHVPFSYEDDTIPASEKGFRL